MAVPAVRLSFRVSPRTAIPSLKGLEVVSAVLAFGAVVDCQPDILEISPDSTETRYSIVLQPSSESSRQEMERFLAADPELEQLRVDALLAEDQRLRLGGDVKVRTDQLHSLERQASEVIASLARLDSILDRVADGRLGPAAAAARLKEARQLQQSIAPMAQEVRDTTRRMLLVPAGMVLSRLHRSVRDLARDLGKQVRLSLTGEDTELERDVLEELREPLLHMVRNSVGHGIEMPDERARAGKPAAGHLQVSAYIAGDNCVMEVRDDGRGLDSSRIRERALQSGLASEQALAAMTEQEVFGFIYHPGFSTAGALSTVSGRGIGMDIVKGRVVRLHGTIEVESRPGEGACFTVRVPLSASLIRALVVEVAGCQVAVPSSSIRSIGFASDWMQARGGGTALVPLGAALGWGEGPAPRVVEVGVAERRIGLAVQSCLDHQELVVRPLGKFLGHVRGVSGAAISSTGRPVLVLDTAELVEQLGL